MKTEQQIHERAQALLKERTALQKRIREIEKELMRTDHQLAHLREKQERTAA